MKYSVIILAVALAVAGIAHLLGQRAFRAERERIEAELSRGPAPTRRGDLPTEVLDIALRGMAGSAEPASVIALTQTADFRTKRGGGLTTLRATHRIATGSPGFVWQAESRIGPVPVVRVVDAFAGGSGWLGVRLLGSIPVGDARGSDTDMAEAMRYLAELPWAPDAILGNPALDWRVITPDRIEVSTPVGDQVARVTFLIDTAGDIVRVEATSRPAETGPDGKSVRRDWRGSFGDYGVMGGRRIPRSAEVGYVYDNGYEAYFIGRITGLIPG